MVRVHLGMLWRLQAGLSDKRWTGISQQTVIVDPITLQIRVIIVTAI